MLYIHTVIIHDDRLGVQEVARAFTNRADAIAFIEDCKRVELSADYSYSITEIQLDGDPLGGY